MSTVPYLEGLDQAALEVPGAGGLDRGVHQALAPRHAVEVVLLRAQPGEEAVLDIPPRAGPRVVRLEAGQRLARAQGLPTPSRHTAENMTIGQAREEDAANVYGHTGTL